MAMNCILNIHNKDADSLLPLRYTHLCEHICSQYLLLEILAKHNTYYVKICVIAKEDMQIYIHMCTRGEAYLLWKERLFFFFLHAHVT